EGFLLEAGPDSFISEKPWALALCERLGLGPHVIATGEAHRRSFIVHRGELHPVPDGFYLLAPTQIWRFVRSPIFSWLGKLRLAADLVLPRQSHNSPNQDESLASFVRRRLGQQALERMAQPMVGGIYTSDPEELSLRATMPRFLEMEQQHRSVIRAMWRARKHTTAAQQRGTSGARYSLFLSFDEGVQVLTDKLAASLSDSIRLNARVNALDFDQSTQCWRL